VESSIPAAVDIKIDFMVVSCLLVEHTPGRHATDVRGVIQGVHLPGAIDLLAQPVEPSLSAAPCDMQSHPARSICAHDFDQTGSEITQHHGDRRAAGFNDLLSDAFLPIVNNLDTLQAGDVCDDSRSR
jgi:hypothetical protein